MTSIAARLAEELSPLFDPRHPGAAVLVMHDGHVVFRRGFGLADIASQTPIETDMVFRLGSVSKQFTAVAILMLAEKKLLDLQADITAYIAYPTTGKRITIEHLLTHTSGIFNYTSTDGFDDQADRDRTVAEMVACFQDEPLGFEPGDRYDYSNSNYFLLGAIIEAVSGKPFGTFMEQHVFVPLSMHDTAYEGMERTACRRATGYKHTPDGFLPCDVISMSQPYAAGAIVSTVEDLALWERALDAGILLKPEVLAQAFRPFILNDGSTAGYGYGWDTTPICSAEAQWHDGGINGYSTFVLRMPAHGLFIAVLSNCEEGIVEPKDVAERIVGLLVPSARTPMPSMQTV
jgi:D-alanyl-D-alanine carboxypeptidase